MANIGSLVANILLDTSRLKNSSAKAQTQFKNIEKTANSSMKKAGSSIINLQTALVSLSALGAFRIIKNKIIDVGISFERAMTTVRVISRATEEQLKDLTEVAKEMGSTTEFTATQAAGGLKFLALAGLEVEEQIGALPQVLDLATAAQIDLAKAADISTNIMTQMGLEVKDIVSINDALVAVQSTANTEVEAAADAFVFAGTKARAFGLDVVDLSSLIGLLANAGIRGGMAGTTLRQSMIALLNPAKEAQEVLNKYGIEVSDTEDNLRNFIDILKDFSNANLSAIEINKVFTSRASNIQVVINEGADAIDAYNDELRSLTGISEEAATLLRQDLQGSVDNLSASIEALTLKVFATFRDELKGITEDTIGVVDAFSDWVEINKELIASGVVDTIKGLGDALNTVKISLAAILPLLKIVVNVGTAASDIIQMGLNAGLIAINTILPLVSGKFRIFADVLFGSTTLADLATKSFDELIEQLDKVNNVKEPPKDSLLGWFSNPNTTNEVLKKAESIRDTVKAMFPESIFPGVVDFIGPPEAPGFIGPPEAPPDLSGFIGPPELGEEQKKQLEEFRSNAESTISSLSSTWDDFYLTQKEKIFDWREKQEDALFAIGETNAQLLADRLISEEEFATRQAELATSEVELAMITAQQLEAISKESNERIDQDTIDRLSSIKLAMFEWAESVKGIGDTLASVMGSVLDQVSSGISNMVLDMVTGAQSIGESLKALFSSILKTVLAAFIKMGIQRLILKVLNLTSTATEHAARISALASETYAAAFASTAAIFPGGPALAPVVAAASTATMLTGQAAAGAAGLVADDGIDFVPNRTIMSVSGGERVINPTENKEIINILRDVREGTFRNNDNGVVHVSINLDGVPFAHAIAPAIKESVSDEVDFGLEPRRKL